MVGSCKYSDITVFSFHPVKTLTTGEGGVVTTNSKKIYERLLRLKPWNRKKDQSMEKQKIRIYKWKKNMWYYEMQELGFNYRITDIQCALGLSQLNKLKKIVNQRAKIAKIYDKDFKSLKNLYLPQNKHRDLSSNHLYVLNLNFRKIGLTKYKFMKSLYEKGIITQVHYIPIHLHPFFKKRNIKK